MKLIGNVMNRLSLLNSGYSIQNRSLGVRIIVVAGCVTIIVLAVSSVIFN